MSASISQNPLAYLGIDLEKQPPLIRQARVPTTNDLQEIGVLWANTSTSPPDLYLSQGEGTWVIVASGGAPALQTLTGNTGGAISPDGAGNISLVGSSGTTVAGSGNTLTITATPQSFTWNDSATSTALVPENGYIIKAGAQSFSLPATSSVGDEIALMLNGGTSWTITQAAGQQIRVGANASTAGAVGSVASTAVGDTIWMICTVANLEWQALNFVGALNVV